MRGWEGVRVYKYELYSQVHTIYRDKHRYTYKKILYINNIHHSINRYQHLLPPNSTNKLISKVHLNLCIFNILYL